MFKFIIRFTIVLKTALSMHSSHSSEPANLLTWESCNYGDTIENLCNKCVCTSKGVYDCEARDCHPSVLEVYLDSREACHPKSVYNQGSTSCICTAEGQWPHKTCHNTFRYLPKNSIKKKTCKPNGYFRLDCNVCRCNAKGEVDTSRCTLNECDDKSTSRKNNQPEDDTSNLFGACLIRNWYSLGPCQFCYCMDTNKLMCSTSLTQGNKKNEMALGKSNLVLCGPGLLKEVAALVPGSKSYRTLLKSYIGRVMPGSSVEVRSIKSTEYTSKETFEDGDKTEGRDDETLTLNEGRKASKVSVENMDEDEVKAQNIMQHSRGVNKKGIKSNDVEISLAATIDTAMMPNKTSIKIGNYDIFGALRKSLKNSRRGLMLASGTKCKPGSIINVKCNICHCLKNSKMLCTDKKCN